MDNNIQNNLDTNINIDKGTMSKFKMFLNSNKKMFTTILSTLLVVVMAGSAIYFAYSYRNKSLNTKKASAANPACYLELEIARPIATKPPIVCRNLDISIVIDRSSSMNSVESDGRTKLAWAKEAASGFVKAIQNSGNTSVKVSVVSFGAQGNDGKGTLAAKFNSTLHNALTGDLNSVLSSLNKVAYIDKGTCIQCGIRIGNGQLTNTTNRRVEILLSDGRANRSWTGTSSQNNKTLAINEANTGRSKGIEYRTIGYGLGTNVDSKTLTSIAGGAANYQYKPNVAEWSSAFLKILNELCSPTTSVATSVSSPRVVSTTLPTPISTPALTP